MHGVASVTAAHLNAVLRNNAVGIPPPQTMTTAIGAIPIEIANSWTALSTEKIQPFASLSIVLLSDCPGGSAMIGFHGATLRECPICSDIG